MKLLIRFCAQGLLTSGVVALSYTLLIWLYAEVFQLYGKWAFDQSLGKAQLAGPAPSKVAELHSVIGRMEIPSLHLSTMVLEGAEERDLRLGAGHVPGTALPGETGNVVITGHRDTFFRPLRKIRKNDLIVLTTLHGSHPYVVESTRITSPDDMTVLRPEPRAVLKLVTCYPFGYIGPAPKRFVVHAKKLAASES